MSFALGMPVGEGHRAVRDLHRALALLVEGVTEGKALLSDIPSADRIDYQRAIFYALAGRGQIAMVTDLGRLSKLMEAMVALARWAEGHGLKTRLQSSPYCNYDGPEIPPGAFSADFALTDAWEGFIDHGHSN